MVLSLITAISDNLTEIPGEDVMRKLSSSGISLKHADRVHTDLYQWSRRNPPPATIMVITGHEELEHLASTFSGLEVKGYRILPTYPQSNPALHPLCLNSVSGKLYCQMPIINWRQHQDLFFLTGWIVERVNLPGLVQFAILMPQVLKISQSTSRVKHMLILCGTWSQAKTK
ncbi:uncharacterized protein LOC125585203 [Brassica napus]|uniref:uncharacterized protein LOC125585203 n=1 Tax=Brassica napus TaxID=3708 RepID=UPI0020785C22|nr:uncharacterized protein LOC125585203 [Brassica napus]